MRGEEGASAGDGVRSGSAAGHAVFRGAKTLGADPMIPADERSRNAAASLKRRGSVKANLATMGVEP